MPENKFAVRGPVGVAVWRFFPGREQLCGGWRVRALVWQASLSGPEPDLLPPELRIDFHDQEALTVCADCEVFVITGICGLAGTVALRVGLRVRKRSGKRVLGLPPETAAVGHPGSERAPYWLTRP